MSKSTTRSVALFDGAPQVEFTVKVPESLEEFEELGMVASPAHARKLAVDAWVVKAQGRFRRSAPKSLVEAVKAQIEGLEDDEEATLDHLEDETRERLEAWAERNATEYTYGGTISREMTFEDMLEKVDDLDDDEAMRLKKSLEDRGLI